jgi:hypothetical protein
MERRCNRLVHWSNRTRRHTIAGVEGVAMHRFRLIRDEDVSGVSGTGAVAEGVVFSSGKVVLAWCSEYRSVTVYDNVADLERVHGHEGRTRIEWLDPYPAREES